MIIVISRHGLPECMTFIRYFLRIGHGCAACGRVYLTRAVLPGRIS
jgi:DNA polymerase II large subunit